MLLRLRPSLSEIELDSILGIAKELGYRTRLLDGAGTILELEGEEAPEHRSRFEDHAAVAAVLGEGRELFARQGRPDSVVAVGAARFGGGALSLVAGPCAVEDETRLLEIARAVRAAGGTVLRGGAFKPRTSPYSFQGLGREGLERLARAREATGLAIVTEVLDPREIEPAAGVVDMFQVGSRSMSNAALLTEIGRSGVPVLIKRGLAATAREFLLAAEYVLAAGNDRVVLCERGIRSFDNATRNVLDVGTIAWLKKATHLPVVVDPSHAAGRPDLVRPLARAGVAAGADGVLVEVHPAPHEARSDGAQAISFEALDALARDIDALARLDGRHLVHPPRPESGVREGSAATVLADRKASL